MTALISILAVLIATVMLGALILGLLYPAGATSGNSLSAQTTPSMPNFLNKTWVRYLIILIPIVIGLSWGAWYLWGLWSTPKLSTDSAGSNPDNGMNSDDVLERLPDGTLFALTSGEILTIMSIIGVVGIAGALVWAWMSPSKETATGAVTVKDRVQQATRLLIGLALFLTALGFVVKYWPESLTVVKAEDGTPVLKTEAFEMLVTFVSGNLSTLAIGLALLVFLGTVLSGVFAHLRAPGNGARHMVTAIALVALLALGAFLLLGDKAGTIRENIAKHAESLTKAEAAGEKDASIKAEAAKKSVGGDDTSATQKQSAVQGTPTNKTYATTSVKNYLGSNLGTIRAGEQKLGWITPKQSITIELIGNGCLWFNRTAAMVTVDEADFPVVKLRSFAPDGEEKRLQVVAKTVAECEKDL